MVEPAYPTLPYLCLPAWPPTLSQLCGLTLGFLSGRKRAAPLNLARVLLQCA